MWTESGFGELTVAVPLNGINARHKMQRLINLVESIKVSGVHGLCY